MTDPFARVRLPIGTAASASTARRRTSAGPHRRAGAASRSRRPASGATVPTTDRTTGPTSPEAVRARERSRFRVRGAHRRALGRASGARRRRLPTAIARGCSVVVANRGPSAGRIAASRRLKAAPTRVRSRHGSGGSAHRRSGQFIRPFPSDALLERPSRGARISGAFRCVWRWIRCTVQVPLPTPPGPRKGILCDDCASFCFSQHR